jgi:radical SAM protein with 4Fe4S-binding SPASM domain
MSKQFCILPEGSIYIQPTGQISPCCLLIEQEDEIGHLLKDTLNSAFHGKKYLNFRNDHKENKLSASCIKQCVTDIHNVVHKQSRTNLINNFRESNQDYNSKIVVADLSFGNVCNLTCTFCGPMWSSSWAKIFNEDNSSKSNTTWPIHYFDKEKLMSMADDLKDAKFISIKGGEPFNIPNLDEFLNKLVDLNPNVRLDFLTNGTEISDGHLRALEKFGGFSLTVSTEATGELYRYLRGGKYTWNNVLENIKNAKSAGADFIGIASIILLYNYKYWARDMLEIQNELNLLKFNNMHISAQICKGPLDQSLYTLKQSVRKKLVDDIKSHVAQGLNIQGINEMYDLITKENKVNITKDKILEKITLYDSIRNMDLFSITNNFTNDLDVE